MASQVLIEDVRFLVYGQPAPSGSRFKGTITTESLIGYCNYTSQEEKIVADQELGMHDGGYLGYTDKDGKTFSSEGWLDDQGLTKFKDKIRKAFCKDGNVAYDVVIALPDYDFAKECGMNTSGDWYAVAKKVLNDTFKEMKVDNKNMLWWGNYHCDTPHPHMHLCFMEKHQTLYGKYQLSNKELNRLKLSANREMTVRNEFIKRYNQDIASFFQEKDHLFQEVVQSFPTQKIANDYSDHISILRRKIPKTGRLQYYSKNMLPYRTIINGLIDMVLEDPDIKPMYDTYIQKVSQLAEVMNDVTHSNISTLEHAEEKKLYGQLGNKILKELISEAKQATNPSPNDSTNLPLTEKSDQATLGKEKISLKTRDFKQNVKQITKQEIYEKTGNEIIHNLQKEIQYRRKYGSYSTSHIKSFLSRYLISSLSEKEREYEEWLYVNGLDKQSMGIE